MSSHTESEDTQQLRIITALVARMMKSYSRTPNFHAVAPHLSVMELWLMGEIRRQERAEHVDRVSGDAS